MSDKFKVGDKVRVLNADGNRKYLPCVGQVLTVSYVGGATPADLMDGTYAVGCEDVIGSQHAHRFELVTEPKQFGIGDLRPFMRVVCNNGAQGIVAEIGKNIYGAKFVVLYQLGGFDYISFEPASGCLLIKEVYAAPEAFAMLSVVKRGQQLYSYEDTAKARAKAEAKAALDAALDAAQAAYNALN